MGYRYLVLGAVREGAQPLPVCMGLGTEVRSTAGRVRVLNDLNFKHYTYEVLTLEFRKVIDCREKACMMGLWHV